jgi:hypothetical protein
MLSRINSHNSMHFVLFRKNTKTGDSEDTAVLCVGSTVARKAVEYIQLQRSKEMRVRQLTVCPSS